MLYFLTENRIKAHTTILGNVDAKLIQPLIESCSDQWVKPRTGSHFFNYLLNGYNNQSFNVGDKEYELIGLIQKSLLWRMTSEVVITSSAQLTNKGPQEQDGLNSQPSSNTKLGMLTKHYGAKADFYDNRIIHFIWSNKDGFPEFTSKLNRDCDVDLYPTKQTPYNDIYFF